MLNLVVDEERSTDERVYVTLTHNAFGDARMYRGYGRVSFDIADLLPEGKDQIVVVLGWTDYAQLPQTTSGNFRYSKNETTLETYTLLRKGSISETASTLSVQ